MTNNSRTLYIGMTGDLRKKISQHKEMLIEGFTKRYRITKLLYFEEFSDVRYAIERETRIKTWSRKKKLDVIATTNPDWSEISIL